MQGAANRVTILAWQNVQYPYLAFREVKRLIFRAQNSGILWVTLPGTSSLLVLTCMLLDDTEQHKVMTESGWQNGSQFPFVVGFAA